MSKIASSKNPLLLAARSGRLNSKLNAYLTACHASTDATDGKASKKGVCERIPNLAGFCRSMGCGLSAMEELWQSFPQHADYLCAVFEDEALNAVRSLGIWTTYFKERLGVSGQSGSDEGTMPMFEHDIVEDGA